MPERSSAAHQLSPAELARAGFTESDSARSGLALLAPEAAMLDAITESANPDLALAAMARLAAGDAPAWQRARATPDAVRQLAATLGTSAALGDFVVRHPEALDRLPADPQRCAQPNAWRAAVLAGVGADSASSTPQTSFPAAVATDRLRVEHRTALLQIAALDLTGVWSLEAVTAALSDLADATLEAALAIARAQSGPPAAQCRLAIVALGKAGGGELNYASDVDVVFVGEPAGGASVQPALTAASRLAAAVMQICSAHTTEGSVWEVDAGLRPEGRAGPLVRTLDSHLAYYQRWAHTWEFQALLKARPAAGDRHLAAGFCDAMGPLVWTAADRDGFVTDVQAMRRRVVEALPPGQQDRELKLGSGGLRDVEFAVQLLQLVHGRADESLRGRPTLSALAALTAGGYVGRSDGTTLASAYTFLRTLEHRVQLFQLRRTHTLPTSADDLRRIGRSLGRRGNPGVELEDAWRRHRRDVRRLHEKLFFRPLLAAVAAVPGEELRLTPEAASARLSALGYADPPAALRHLKALTGGLSRGAAIQRQLLPAMLQWFATQGPDPDAALLAFRQLSERLGHTHWYLRHLRDESAAAEQLARVLALSRYVTDLLASTPESVAMLGSDAELERRSADQLATEVRAVTQRHRDDPSEGVRALRTMRRRELGRVATADVLGRLDVEEVGDALSDIAYATLRGALTAAQHMVAAAAGGQLPTRLAVVAMGRLGGRELGYGSDADVMFVHDPCEGAAEREAAEAGFAVAQELRRLLTVPGDDPPLQVDAGLRPEGRQGPLVRTLSSYAAYYRRWSAPWEAQALLRADPAIGDADLCDRFMAMIDPLRWPSAGLPERDVREIRRVKARVDGERLPRGADPTMNLKLGPGGLADVEWTAQLLQLRHAGRLTQLRTTRTLVALRESTAAGLLSEADGHALTTAWLAATRLRNAAMLVNGRPTDTIPRQPSARAAVARLLGYPPGASERMLDDYRRTARRSRAAVQRNFGA